MTFLTIGILFSCLASVALADDFKTIDGKEYKNATVSRVEPDGILIKTKSGISKVYFTELPKEVQERFHYDAQQAAQFTSQTTSQILRDNRLSKQQQVEEAQKREAQKAAEREMQRQQQEAEMQRQQEAERQNLQAAPQQQAQATESVYHRSQEGIPEHTYEILQDHMIVYQGARIRVKRGEQYHGRILVDHAEIDILHCSIRHIVLAKGR